ncbi:MFS transporter [Puteibacter caeruleilacunae]|nr:MFS transporter [Puteibacter caeruleilacunae]
MRRVPNLYSLYIIKLSKWFNMVMPIIVLFFQDNNLSMKDIFILKAIYSVGIVVMEIPSGYFADVWGRKNTLLTGSILGAAGFLTYSVSHSFLGFVVAEIILGVGQSFISGADSAMLYDSLKMEKRQKEYLKLEGRVTSLGNFAEAFAGIVGGLLATITLRTPFFFQFAVAAMAIPAALALKEPPKSKDKMVSLMDILRVTKEAMLNRSLRTAILFSALIGTSTLTYAWFVQPYFKAAELPVGWYGLMWTLLNLTVGIVSIYAYRVDRMLGERRANILILLGICLFYFLTSMYVSLYAFPILFLFYGVRGIATPLLKNYINQYTASEVRATILSVRNFSIRVLFAILGPLLGWMNDFYSLSVALALTGAIVLVIGIVILLPFIIYRKA